MDWLPNKVDQWCGLVSDVHGGGPWPRLHRSVMRYVLTIGPCRSIDDHKRVINRLFDEVWNGRRTEVIPDLYVSDFVADYRPYAPPRRGHDGVCAMVAGAATAFPDYHEQLLSVVVEGDEAAVHLRITGTQLGSWGRLPPTGRVLQFEEMIRRKLRRRRSSGRPTRHRGQPQWRSAKREPCRTRHRLVHQTPATAARERPASLRSRSRRVAHSVWPRIGTCSEGQWCDTGRPAACGAGLASLCRCSSRRQLLSVCRPRDARDSMCGTSPESPPEPARVGRRGGPPASTVIIWVSAWRR